jgi:short-subunit dehydrogenase
MNIGLKDRKAIVTGASSGIGRSIALALAAEGARLCLLGRNSAHLEEVRRCALADSSEVCTHLADLGHEGQLEKVISKLVADYPELDILVHCAGAYHSGTVASAPVACLDQQYRINVRAPFRLTQALLPALRSRKGQVVFMNSSVGLTTKGGLSQYCATKHALRALADCLRDEVNADGVRVIGVFPGQTATPMQAAVYASENRVYQPEVLLQPEDVANLVVQTLCLKQTAEVTNVSIRPLQKAPVLALRTV